MSKRAKGNTALFIAAFIWGTAFVAQRQGMDYIGPFTFNAARNYVAFIVIILFIILRPKKEEITEIKFKNKTKNLLKAGIMCGFLLFLASSFQQIGIKYTSVGKAGFITTLYVIIIPVISIFLGKKPNLKMWFSLFGAILGLYLLCMSNGFENISKGDFYILVCAFCNAFHILTIDHFSENTDGVELSCIQFLVCAVLSSFLAISYEMPNIIDILKSIMPILYTAVLSSGVAYTLQIIGQKYTEPIIASLIMSLESVFSVLAGWLVLGEVLTTKESFGCIIVFAAVILAQLPEKANKRY